jgi:hypothetical protein
MTLPKDIFKPYISVIAEKDKNFATCVMSPVCGLALGTSVPGSQAIHPLLFLEWLFFTPSITCNSSCYVSSRDSSSLIQK